MVLVLYEADWYTIADVLVYGLLANSTLRTPEMPVWLYFFYSATQQPTILPSIFTKTLPRTLNSGSTLDIRVSDTFANPPF